MKASDKQVGSPEIVYTATQSQIEALSGIEAGAIALASDTGILGVYSGSGWNWFSNSGQSIVSYFTAYRTANWVLPSGSFTWHKIPWTNTYYNSNGDFDTGTYTWTIPADGMAVVVLSALLWDPNWYGWGYTVARNGTLIHASVQQRHKALNQENSINALFFTFAVSEGDLITSYAAMWNDGELMPWISSSQFSGVLIA